MRNYSRLGMTLEEWQQEAWVIALQALNRWQRKGSLGAFLGATLKWLGINEWRKQRRHRAQRIVDNVQVADMNSWKPFINVTFVPSSRDKKQAYWKRFRRLHMRQMRQKRAIK